MGYKCHTLKNNVVLSGFFYLQDLQVLLLKFYEELIAAKVAKETMEEQEQTLRCEIQLIRDQMSGEHEERVSMEDSLTQELNNIK